MDPKNLEGLIARGEQKLKAEEWEEAVRAFEQAFEASGRSSQEVCGVNASVEDVGLICGLFRSVKTWRKREGFSSYLSRRTTTRF